LWGPKNVKNESDRYCLEIAAGDLDGDGDIDAVSNHFDIDSGSTGFLAIHRNNGGGVFTTTTLPSIQTRIRQIRIVDINNDGLRDIVIACNTQRFNWQTQTGVYWYKNDGGMNFTRYLVGTGRCNAWKVFCIDFNGDNHKEIVVTEEWWGENSSSPCRLILFKNNGAETFNPQIIDPNLAPGGIGAGGAGVICADFDKDGDMDFVACGRNYWVAWYDNLGPTSPGSFSKHIFDTQWQLFDLPYTTYLDGDSCCDLIVSIDGYSDDGRFVAYLSPCSTAAVEETKYTYGTNWMKVLTIISSNFAKVEYSIQDRGEIRLDVIDMAGRTVQVIEQGYCSQPGVYKTAWNLTKEPRGSTSNGIYFVRLKAKNIPPIVKKVTVIRNR